MISGFLESSSGGYLSINKLSGNKLSLYHKSVSLFFLQPRSLSLLLPLSLTNERLINIFPASDALPESEKNKESVLSLFNFLSM